MPSLVCGSHAMKASLSPIADQRPAACHTSNTRPVPISQIRAFCEFPARIGLPHVCTKRLNSTRSGIESSAALATPPTRRRSAGCSAIDRYASAPSCVRLLFGAEPVFHFVAVFSSALLVHFVSAAANVTLATESGMKLLLQLLGVGKGRAKV
jgi:hypothetical protein